jgi:D-alanine-D-alanine ligase
MKGRRAAAEAGMDKKAFGKVVVLLGGRSAEREVSLKSGARVLAALKAGGVDAHGFDPQEQGLPELIAGGFDRAFIVLHGRFGEDGTVQGVLEWLGIPYTGSGVLASAIAMDKLRTKLLWEASGIPTPKWARLEAGTDFGAVVQRLGLPIMVKPAREGSSIGMSKVTRAPDLPLAYEHAVKHDDVIIAEQFIEGIELTAGVLGGTPLPLIRLETPRTFYDYEAKYLVDSTRYILPCGLPEEQERDLQHLVLKAFAVPGCRGWGRVDLMLDQAGNPYFLEVNTIPGMTDHSLVPMGARAAGYSFEDLVLKILEAAA